MARNDPTPPAPDWRQLLSPLLELQPGGEQPEMLRVVGEGTALPDLQAERRLHALLRESIGWLGRVLQPSWQVGDPAYHLLAAREAFEGQDAFVGAWTQWSRDLQVIVTRERIHLLTRLYLAADSPADAALRFAPELLALEGPLRREEWRVEPFAGLHLGERLVDEPARWEESLIFLTDGEAVKYSLLKDPGAEEARKGDLAGPDPRPWFPRRG